jgi:hypothetical protein
VPGLEGAYAATGHYRSGILLAPITGLLCMEILLQHSPTLPFEPYRLTRLLPEVATPSPQVRHLDAEEGGNVRSVAASRREPEYVKHTTGRARLI